jgi:hypothetical protein
MERRVSLDRCRRLLGAKLPVSDENLALVREQLYCFAELIFDVRADKKNSSNDTGALLERAAKSKEELEILQERAAIIEFDADVSRDEAERMAISLALENEREN